MQKKFLIPLLIFFAPVVLGYGTLEWLVTNIPSQFAANERYLNEKERDIEILALGSSQMMNAVNPEWITPPLINMASGNQHHDTDFAILKAMNSRLTNLKTLVLEVSYSHFELPHNGPKFWKNSAYLKYYDVNCYKRHTYFKDRLLYLSNPTFFSDRIWEYYVDKKHVPHFNAYGFNAADMYGQFAANGFEEKKIRSITRFKINREENLPIFNQNTQLFFEMLEYAHNEGLRVVLCTLPMYETYLEARNPDVLRRRDSILQMARTTYPNVQLLLMEEKTSEYDPVDFWNQSHLAPSGTQKFCRVLEETLTIPK